MEEKKNLESFEIVEEETENYCKTSRNIEY